MISAFLGSCLSGLDPYFTSPKLGKALQALALVPKKIAFPLAGRLFCGYTCLRHGNQSREPVLRTNGLADSFGVENYFHSGGLPFRSRGLVEKCI
jgi:hypothetical protein